MPLPAWASKMRDLFRSGSVAQFLLHGNVFDVIPHGDRQLSLKAFLDEAMFGAYDTVLQYDRSRGVRALPQRRMTRGGAGCSLVKFTTRMQPRLEVSQGTPAYSQPPPMSPRLAKSFWIMVGHCCARIPSSR